MAILFVVVVLVAGYIGISRPGINGTASGDRWNIYGDGAFTKDSIANEDVIDFLLDNEIYSVGKVASYRERLWAIGLQMILEKYGN